MVLVVSFNTATFSLYPSLSTVKIIFIKALVNCFLRTRGHQQLLLFIFCKLNRYVFSIGWRTYDCSKFATQSESIYHTREIRRCDALRDLSWVSGDKVEGVGF